MQFARFSLVLLLAAKVKADAHGSDIVDTAVANNFTILAEALTKAGLVDTLKGTGPFTVFAPTDAAFAAALTTLQITKAELLARADLGAILTYHVVSGTVLSTGLTDGMTPATVQGSNVTIAIAGSTVKVNAATVTSADVMCSNGVIHVIDQVLIPPADTTPLVDPIGLKDIVDTAVAAGSFTVLAEALTKADLVTTLKGTGPFTVFAPTDDAFAAALTALGATKEELLARTDLAAVLTYHVVSGTVKSTDLTDGMTPATVQGSTVTIAIAGSTVKVNTATVTSADVMCSNGVIHIIDQVLLPPSEETEEAGPTPSGETVTPAAQTDADAAYTARGFVSLTFAGILSAFALA